MLLHKKQRASPLQTLLSNDQLDGNYVSPGGNEEQGGHV